MAQEMTDALVEYRVKERVDAIHMGKSLYERYYSE